MASPSETKPSCSSNFLLWIPVGLALYALSIGPVMKYFWFAEEMLRVVYFPIFLCHKIAFLDKLIDAYLNLWGLK